MTAILMERSSCYNIEDDLISILQIRGIIQQQQQQQQQHCRHHV